MTYTPIPRGTPDWDVPVNDALTDQDARITQNAADINVANTNIGAVGDQVALNTTNIATNTTNIATNTANIATNTSNISSLQTRTAGQTFYLLVAASNAPAAVKAKADYVCDGTADNVEIQAAIDAAKAQGGGVVQLSAGAFSLAATITISGNTNEDDADSITLVGAGQQATTLTMATNTNGIELTGWAVVNMEKLGIVVSGSGSCLHSTAVLTAGNEVSFWHSSFRDLRLNGFLGSGSTTGWGMDLAMPWRSTFENIEIEGTANGMRLSNQGTIQNAGDCTFTRMFIEIVGNNHTAIHISSPSNNMNQNDFNMVEIGANGTGCTGILIDGASGGASQRFWGLNAEQFQTTINVANGESNVFDCNYVTGDTGQPGNVMFQCGSNAYNNRFSAKWVNVASGDALQVINDTNTTSNAPNIFDGIRLEVNGTGSVTYARTNSTVFRDITTFNPSGTIQAGLLQYPLSVVNNASFTPADQGLIAWTTDPAEVSGTNFTLAAGTIYLGKVKIVNRSTVVTNILMRIFAAGTTLTAGQNFVGLYDSSGNRLAISADQTTAFGTVGNKTIPLTAPVTLAVGTYYVAFLSNGTGTQPSVAGGAGNSDLTNIGLATSAARFLNTAAGNTALPATITLGSQSVNPASRWAGLS